MNKDNKIFAAKIDKKISNNNSLYSSLNHNDDYFNVESNDNRNVMQKINDIFNSRNYVYKADVVIKTDKETLKKTIIGKNTNYLITNENELISINEIKDIRRQ